MKMNSRRRLALRRETVLLLALAVLLVFSALPPGQRFWRWAQARAGLSPYPAAQEQYPLNIYCLSVGKADAILISCEGEYALIDSATFDKADEVWTAARHVGAQEIKLAFATHPDSDHIGGFPLLFGKIPVGQLVQSEFPGELTAQNEEYALLEKSLREHSVGRLTAQAGDSFRVGGAELTVLGPVGEYADVNNYSLVLKLRYGDFSMLFCGDMEEAAEADLMASGADLRADCLKIAHHGSKTSSTEAFLQAVGAGHAVVSAGPDRNNLPRTSVLRRIENAGMEIYRTDLDGTVRISSDGTEIEIATGEN